MRRRRHVTCQRCGYRWKPYGPPGTRPEKCANPACRSPLWHRPRRFPQKAPPRVRVDWEVVTRLAGWADVFAILADEVDEEELWQLMAVVEGPPC